MPNAVLAFPAPTSSSSLNSEDVARMAAAALAEDIGQGDLTSLAVIDPPTRATACLRAREPMLVAGMDFAIAAFRQCDPAVNIEVHCPDGSEAEAGVALATINGLARPLLGAERTAVNFLQILSGIATLTSQYAAALRGTPVKLLDTRKTLPGLRLASKYATALGGAQNHRLRLDDAILIKDNHLALSGRSLPDSVRRAKAMGASFVMVECETLEQVDEALSADANWLLLDNMTLAGLRQAVTRVNGRIPLEASGGVTLNSIRAIAETGVNYISVGAITHSARAVDIGLDIGGRRQAQEKGGAVPYLA